MPSTLLLESLTDVAGRQAEILLGVVNFYGLVVLAVVGWLVNTAKSTGGTSWFRVLLFDAGLVLFFGATFYALWLLYGQLAQTMALWSDVAAASGGADPARIATLAYLPPRIWIAWIWPFNLLILSLATVVLRRGGTGREAERA